MKAVLLTEAGGVENLRLQEIEEPKPAEGEVLVKVRAISVNPADVKVRRNDEMLTAFLGTSRPVVLGWDFAGEVIEVAEGAGSFRIGDGVFGVLPSNRARGYAEYVVVPTNIIARKPDNVSYEAAATATMAAVTAWNPLVNDAPIKPGDTVLIHAGSGGVGHFAIQIAKHFGATVIATSSARNREFVLSLGADQHVDYTTKRLEEAVADVDFVLDTIGGETLEHSIAVVKAGGRIITVIPAAGEALIEKARQRSVALSFGGMRHSAEDLTALAALLEQGIVKPYISATYTLDQMAQAHTHLESGRTIGKVVVTL